MRILHIELFTIRIINYQFKAPLIPSLVMVLVILALINLGQWQLGRAEFKSDLEQRINTRTKLSPVNYSDLIDIHKDRLFYPVILRGQYDGKHPLLHDNQVFNKRAGYDIYMPFKTNDGLSLLIKRGWLPQEKSRAILPDIITPKQEITLKGILIKPPSPGLILSDRANSYSQWPAVVQYLDLATLEKKLDRSIQPEILLLNKDNPSAYQIAPLKFRTDSNKHMGYAFQWFAMALAVLIIYLTVNTKRIHSTDE